MSLYLLFLSFYWLCWLFSEEHSLSNGLSCEHFILLELFAGFGLYAFCEIIGSLVVWLLIHGRNGSWQCEIKFVPIVELWSKGRFNCELFWTFDIDLRQAIDVYLTIYLKHFFLLIHLWPKVTQMLELNFLLSLHRLANRHLSQTQMLKVLFKHCQLYLLAEIHFCTIDCI